MLEQMFKGNLSAIKIAQEYFSNVVSNQQPIKEPLKGTPEFYEMFYNALVAKYVANEMEEQGHNKGDINYAIKRARGLFNYVTSPEFGDTIAWDYLWETYDAGPLFISKMLEEYIKTVKEPNLQVNYYPTGLFNPGV